MKSMSKIIELFGNLNHVQVEQGRNIVRLIKHICSGVYMDLFFYYYELFMTAYMKMIHSKMANHLYEINPYLGVTTYF